jgi:hypothetical protein
MASSTLVSGLQDVYINKRPAVFGKLLAIQYESIANNKLDE